jgi:hypothetical protein
MGGNGQLGLSVITGDEERQSDLTIVAIAVADRPAERRTIGAGLRNHKMNGRMQCTKYSN